jgi:UDP-N-acetylmuramoyl-L-alanyl-D-glutamate--2,6-diaminopimelate ligase
MIAIIGKGHEDYQEMNGVRHHFLDREEVLEAVRILNN